MHIEKKNGNVLMNVVLLPVLPLVLAFPGLLPNNLSAAEAIASENRQARAAAEPEMKPSVEGILAAELEVRGRQGYAISFRFAQ
jgi:hypothetical protein